MGKCKNRKNGKKKRREKPYQPLPSRGSPSTPAQHEPTRAAQTTARAQPNTSSSKKRTEGVVLIPSPRMVDSTKPCPASSRCCRRLLVRRRDEACSAPYKYPTMNRGRALSSSAPILPRHETLARRSFPITAIWDIPALRRGRRRR
jgi:hypothetical protein